VDTLCVVAVGAGACEADTETVGGITAFGEGEVDDGEEEEEEEEEDGAAVSTGIAGLELGLVMEFVLVLVLASAFVPGFVFVLDIHLLLGWAPDTGGSLASRPGVSARSSNHSSVATNS
jgi:hypothetical protein